MCDLPFHRSFVDSNRLKRHMITTRNESVVNNLRQIYQPTVRDVFCTSKPLYWDYRDERREVALRWLQLSGIIRLRRHCLSLVAERQLQDASTFMRDRIPSLVSEIDLWVRSGSGRIAAETRQQVREAARAVEHILQRVGITPIHSIT